MPPTANLILVLNLGSEMLYVIDQRLRAQSIALDKSAQVLRDLSAILLDSRFLDQLVETESTLGTPLSAAQVRLLIADIACSSLMRLDPVSMDKLWDLMVVIFKWQLFVARNDPHRIINITFKHLDGIAKMMPEMKKGFLVDVVKMRLLALWDSSTDEQRTEVAEVVSNWLRPFRVKISILMRLGMQDDLCNFLPIDLTNRVHSDLLANIGENIYKKYPKEMNATSSATKTSAEEAAKATEKEVNRREFDELADQLQITPLDVARDRRPAAADAAVLSILDTLNIGGLAKDSDTKERTVQYTHEFVQIRSSHSSEEFLVDATKVPEQPDLLELIKVPPHVSKY